MKKLLLFFAAMLVAGSMWANEVTFTFKTDNDITYTAKGTSGGGAACDVQKSGIRLQASNGYTESIKTLSIYAGGSLTITSSTSTQIKITSVTATYVKSSRPFSEAMPSGVTDATEKLSSAGDGTWSSTDGASSVTLNNVAIGKTELTKLVVTYSVVTTNPYTVTFNAGTKGTCSTSSLSEATAGAGVTLPACTPNTGYAFKGWSTTDGGTTADAGAANATYNPSANCTLYAVYKKLSNVTLNTPVGGQYTVKVGSGEIQTITTATTINDVEEGTIITFASTANDNYQLHSTPFKVKDADNGDVSVSKSGNIYSITMPSKAVTVTAQYVATYSITNGDCTNGSVEASVARTSKGSKVTVTVTPNEHYHISKVYFVKEGEETQTDITATDNIYSFSMVESNVTVYATFTEDEKVTVSWIANGTTIKEEQVYPGDAGTAPSTVDNIADYGFVGWYNSDIEETNIEPKYVTDFSVNTATAFNAVYKRSTSSGAEDEGEFYFYANVGGTKYYLSSKPVTVGSSSTIQTCLSSTNKAEAFPITVTKKADSQNEYSLSFVENGTTYYLFCKKVSGSSTSYYLQSQTEEAYFTKSAGTNGSVRFVSSSYTTRGLIFRASTYNYFRFYNATNASATSTEYYDLELEQISSNSTNFYTTSPIVNEELALVATDGNNYYATFSCSRAVEFTDENINVYTVTISGTAMTLNSVAKKVPANTGVLIKTTATTANYDYIASATSLGNNDLRAASAAKEDSGYKFYMLAYSDNNCKPESLGFYWGAENGAAFESREGSAYLAVPQSTNQAPARFVFGQTDITTDVESVEAETAVKYFENGQLLIKKDGRVYNAMGQLVR